MRAAIVSSRVSSPVRSETWPMILATFSHRSLVNERINASKVSFMSYGSGWRGYPRSTVRRNAAQLVGNVGFAAARSAVNARSPKVVR